MRKLSQQDIEAQIQHKVNFELERIAHETQLQHQRKAQQLQDTLTVFLSDKKMPAVQSKPLLECREAEERLLSCYQLSQRPLDCYAQLDAFKQLTHSLQQKYISHVLE